MTGDAVRCRWCGSEGPAAPAATAAGWLRETEDGETRWLCPACVRTHLREIEGKLAVQHW